MPRICKEESILFRSFLCLKWGIVMYLMVQSDIASAQNTITKRSNLDFKILNVEKGLSHNNVFNLFQDSEGYIWIATENGLNKYNGHELKIFKREENSENEICGNEISSITEDDEGNIWIGAYNAGICRYNKKTGKFKSVDINKDDDETIISVHTIHYNKGFLWIGDEYGTITRLNTKDFTFKTFTPSFDVDRQIVFQDAIKAFYSDDQFIWASSNSGFLFKIDLETDNFEILNVSKAIGEVVQLTDIVEISPGELTLASSGGLIQINKETFNIVDKPLVIKSFKVKVNDYFVDRQENTWLLTEGVGIVFYEKDGEKLQFDKSQFSYQNIPELDCRKIIQTSDGVIWIATYGGGVIQYNPNKSVFNHYLFDPSDDQGLRDGGINCFYKAPDGHMWIGTDAGGLHKFNPKDGSFQNFNNSRQLSQFYNTSSILDIKEAGKQNELWIGTYKYGLMYFNPNTGFTKSYKFIDQDSYHPSHSIYTIAQYSDSIMWLGTNGHGVIEFNRYTRKFGTRHCVSSDTSSLSNDYIRSVYRDSNGDMWVGSFGRLNKYLGNGKFKGFVHVEDDSLTINNGLITQIYEDSRGLFWLGNQGEGLMLMDREEELFYTYGNSDGLFINHVYGIIEDENGILWLTTNNGLVSAEVTNHDAAKPKLNFRYFYEENGLQDDSFIGGAIFQNDQNQIYVGGQNGFNFFNPEEALSLSDYHLKIYLEDLTINGEPTFTNSENGISKSVEYLDTLTLFSEASDISLNITAINFEITKKLHYSYQLEGYEKNWNYVQNTRRVTYTNLPLGEYNLKVRTSFDGKNWISRDKNLKIIVIGPWYKYWYGRMIIVTLLLLLIFVVYLMRVNSIKKQKLKLQKLVEEQSKEIRSQNNELVLRNEQLNHQYEEILKSREEIAVKNDDLREMHEKLQTVNSVLEAKVQKRTEQLNNTIEQLNESIHKLDKFLANTSNELDAPIKSIQGFLTVLKLNNSPEKNMTLLQQLDHNILQIELIKKQLEDFSKNSKSGFKYEKINIKKLADEVIHGLSLNFDISNFSISNKIDKSAEIFSDADRLKIVFSNVIGNALGFYDEKKKDHLIELFSDENVANWSIHIKDNGIGIKKNSLQKLFQMYYRSNGNSHGAGLGLFVSKEILTNLQSSISIDSTLGKETEVIISFPKAKRSN